MRTFTTNLGNISCGYKLKQRGECRAVPSDFIPSDIMNCLPNSHLSYLTTQFVCPQLKSAVLCLFKLSSLPPHIEWQRPALTEIDFYGYFNVVPIQLGRFAWSSESQYFLGVSAGHACVHTHKWSGLLFEQFPLLSGKTEEHNCVSLRSIFLKCLEERGRHFPAVSDK